MALTRALSFFRPVEHDRDDATFPLRPTQLRHLALPVPGRPAPCSRIGGITAILAAVARARFGLKKRRPHSFPGDEA